MESTTKWMAIIEQDYESTNPDTGEGGEIVSIPVGKVTCFAPNAEKAHEKVNKWITDCKYLESGRISGLICIDQFEIFLP